jgi:hypothetical protein
MDNLQFWLYIIIAIVYVISRAMKKSNAESEAEIPDQPAPTSRRSYESSPKQSNPTKSLTFEELLKEITVAKSQPATSPYVDYDDDLDEEERSIEKASNYTDSDSFRIFEQAKAEAFARPSLEELEVKHGEIQFGKFKEFDSKQEAGILDEYISELRDPQGFKKAIVMSEILNRKHF